MTAAGSRVPSALQFSPMLAQDLPETFQDWPVLASPKIDGVRAVAMVDASGARLYSRTGQPVHSLPELLTVLDGLPPGIYDGELHHPGGFQLTCSIFRRGPANLHPDRAGMVFHLFDLTTLEDWMQPRQSAQYRAANLARVLEGSRVPSALQLVPHQLVFGRADFDALHASHMAAGHEGTCLRTLSPYQHGRGSRLWRLKPTITLDARVLGIEQGKPGSQFARCIGSLKCQDIHTGERFKVGAGLDLPDRLATDWVGQVIEIQCKGLTESGKPREPIFSRRRSDLFQEPLPCLS